MICSRLVFLMRGIICHKSKDTHNNDYNEY